MDSLYGGKPGISFIIKASYPSINDAVDGKNSMVAAFQQGNNYKDVWYGEYVLIDTPNKNDKDNGKIFRRGLDYLNEMGGAEYIGQIVGPSSGTPYFSFDTIPNTKKQATKEMGKYEYKRYPIGKDEQGNYITSEGNGTDIAEFELNAKQGLVPGKTANNKFNDSIKYTWVNIRMDNADSDSWFYVGFEIPYLVIDYSTVSINPYDTQGNYSGVPSATRIDEKNSATGEFIHPYYESWRLGIPKGIKGDSLHNFRVTTLDAEKAKNNTVYNVTAISTSYDKTGLKFVTTVNKNDIYKDTDHTGTTKKIGESDTVGPRKILVLDYVVYDNKSAGEIYTLFIGDYNMINSIIVDDYGTIDITMTHDNNYTYTKKIRWIKSIGVSNETGSRGGYFTIEWNNDNPVKTEELHISWIKSIEIKTNGTVQYTYAGREQDLVIPTGAKKLSDGVYTLENFMKWINSISLNPDTGVFTIKYNYGSDYTVTLDWVKDIFIDETTGEIALQHTKAASNTGTATNKQKAEILDAKLKLITGGDIADTGEVTFHTNTGVDMKLKKTENKNSDFHINMIKDMVVRNIDWHLLVLFNDPEHRTPSSALNDKNEDSNGNIWANNVIGSNGTNYGSNVYWRDFGPIKDQGGVLIGFNVTEEEVKAAGFSTILEYLNNKFPNGLTGEEGQPGAPNTKDKIVTFNYSGVDDKEFYAFDYAKAVKNEEDCWYYLGSIADTGMRDVGIINRTTEGGILQSTISKINVEGLLFSTYNVTYNDNALPTYWGVNYTS